MCHASRIGIGEGSMLRNWSVRNFNKVYRNLTDVVWHDGEHVAPRGQKTREILGNVIELAHPQERVLTVPGRRANPFFAWAESAWILHGSRDIEWIAHYNSEMKKFLDADGVAWGVYGYRLRYAAGYDQLEVAVNRLTQDPDSRRGVLSLWHATLDATEGHADYPCNAMVFLKLRDKKLHMTVLNRSNDLHLGFAAVNVCQWTTIQETLACGLDAGPGVYRHYSDSLHIYEENVHTQAVLAGADFDVYEHVKPTRIGGSLAQNYKDVETVFDLSVALRRYWLEKPVVLSLMSDFSSPYWQACAKALVAWDSLKCGVFNATFETLVSMLPACPDWYVALVEF